MKNDDIDILINNLISVINGQMNIETFKQKFKPDYTDINGNGCFHILTEYSFERYCLQNIKLNKNEKIVSFQDYNEIKNKYNQQIISFIKILTELNYDLLSPNKINQGPLYFSIIKNNYIISKEYYKIAKSLDIYIEDDYYHILNLIINNGSCLEKDCIELLMILLTSTDKNKNNIFNKELLNKENKNYKLTSIVSLCKNFSENIYEKYNEIIKIVSMEYINKDNNKIYVKQEQNSINNIREKAFKILNDYINDSFLPLFMKLIQLGANLQLKNESGFNYLMAYPFIKNLSNFIKENKININFQDSLGNTALMNLINSKEYIIKISKDIYINSFKSFINNENIDITKKNNNGISAFYLCLINEYYDDAKLIYQKFKNTHILTFNSYILIFLIQNPKKFINFLNNFKNEIDFDLFNIEKKRTLFHYICLYLSENIYINDFIQIFSFLSNLKIDYFTKDEFNRNFLFYLFLDENDKSKILDPIQQLKYCLQLYKFNNLNEKDIFGNNLLFYAIQSKALHCLDYLINNGIILTNEQNSNENSIYSISLLNKDFKIFYFLYNKIKDLNIFSHKIYEPYEIEINENEYFQIDKFEKGETLYDFLNKSNNNNIKKNKNLFKKNLNINIINNNNIFNAKREFNYFNFLYDDVLKILDKYTSDIIIKIKDNNYNNEINTYINEKTIISNFIKKNDDYIYERKNSQRNIISENLFRYSLSNNYEDICRFIINEKYNLISICADLIFFHKFNDINECIQRILSENNNDPNKLANLKDEKGQTIYHLLPKIQNNLFICKYLENHKISNLFDKEGNTPMYYACENFNVIFIETFSHYSFDSIDNKSNNVNYSLFLESKNNTTPLEVLYNKLNKRDNTILKIIIDISINLRKVYFIPVIKYLIQNYSPLIDKNFKDNYKNNLSSGEYLHKIIGLYQFYTHELNENIMIKDESGNDPFFICAINHNYNFIFNILIDEHNISLNTTNNEGKSIIHLILQLSGYLNTYKENTLKRAIESGFDFNIKDNDGMLPIDYAYLEGDYHIANILIDYYENFEMKIPENKHIKPKDEVNYNFCKDSDIFYNESISIAVKIDKFENLNELVSTSFKYDPLKSFYKVCLDEKNSLPFSINLVKKDFINLNENNDKKFCMQIIKDDLNSNNEYLIITVDNLDLKIYNFSDFNSAQKRFKEIFKEITANDWDNVMINKLNFKTNYSRYYILDYSYEEEYAIYEYLKITIKNLYIKKKSEYKGNIKIKNLIYYLLVKVYQNKFSLDENNLNVENKTKIIIQKYKSTAIKKAISILFQIKNLLNEQNKNEIYFKKRNYLINSYNDLIPYSHKSKDFNLFNESLNIDFEISRLTTYYYIENVLKIFLGAIYNLNNMHPLDYIINALGSKIEELPKPQNNNNNLISESDYVYNYVNITNSLNTPITTIYKITQSINDKNFNLNNYDNRYIFFHGTKVENIIGILSQGLKIAPVQAINTGKAYGNGIYLSDAFSYSLNYCYSRDNLFGISNRLNNKCFMFMVEVAVGNIGKTADTDVVKMSMDFNDYFTTNEGYRIFKNSNKAIDGNGIIVVHEETNVRIKYLIEIN